MKQYSCVFKSLVRPLLAVAVACGISCAKENGTAADFAANRIVFRVSDSSTLSSVTVQRRANVPVSCSCLTLDGGREPMYLHAITREGIEVSPKAETRESRAEPVTGTTIADAGIVAFDFYGDWNESLAPDFMYDVRITKASGWATDYHYPNDGSKVRFYAYSPYGCKGVELSGKGQTGIPAIRYTVPESVDEQCDVMCAVSDDIVSRTAGGTTSLVFRHALSAVKFVTGDDIAEGTIKSVALKGVFDSGVCPLGDIPVWTAGHSTGDFSQALDKMAGGVADEPITAESQTFMMIPQTLPDGATVEVVIDDGSEHTLSASLAGVEWKAGQTTVYRISSSSITGEPVFAVTAPAAFAHTGGTATYKVASYRLRTDGTKTAVAWSVTGYSTDGGATWSDSCPDWLALTTAGTGSDSEEELPATAEAQTADIGHYEKLSQNSPVSGVYDLATDGGTAPMNTANCYIINAAGRYSLPLVYGNAIKDGATNAAAYTSSVAGDYILTAFVNHLGEAITSPYIYENADCTPADAVVVWQDKADVVTGVALSADNRSLEFEVPRENIDQANAVVAVRDADGNIMWSWHIWITDYRLGAGDIAVTNAEGLQYDFMPLNLGWCYTSDDSYPARSVSVRFTQNGSKGLERIVEFRQSAYVGNVSGGSTYYQWGRKDPLPPADGFDNGDTGKTYYDSDGTAQTEIPFVGTWGDKTGTIKGCILNPLTFCTSAKMNQSFDNLWSADNYFEPDATTIRKTVYDPSPVGYSVPPMAAFNNLKLTDVAGGWSKGWYFYCDAAKENTIYLPAVGYRTETNKNIDYGKLTAVGYHAYYATGTPYKKISTTQRYAGSFYIFTSRAEVTNRHRMTGMSVRCIRERE